MEKVKAPEPSVVSRPQAAPASAKQPPEVVVVTSQAPAPEPPPESQQRGRVVMVAGMSPEVYARVSEQAYLRDRAEKTRGADRSRAKLFVDAARQAQGQGDIVAAAQHYRLALQVAEDPEVRKALQAIEQDAQKISYESSLKMATAAEKGERWAVAATKYAAAYAAMAEPRFAERTAYALLKQGTDVRRAVSLAEQAVLAEPSQIEFRCTLAEALLAAGLLARAAGEIARALALAPERARAKEIEARVIAATQARPGAR